MFGSTLLPEAQVDWIHTREAAIVASVFAAVSIVISIAHIIQHLYHYTMPGIQLYVIRILVICPVYAVTSALALGLGSNGAYAEIARDVYEAFVIYSFLNLILEYCGGETDCIYQIENEPQLRMPCPLCFLKPRPRDARLMRLCHRGVLQFIIVKPFVAITDVIMIATGNYYKLPYQIFEFIVYNISYAWALYCMFVFYLATSKLIKKFRPVMKFATVKAIVFATYYQSLGVKASSMSPENSYMWNDFILCVEMVLFAALLMCAFPTSEFQGGIPDSRFMDNVKSVLSVRDVVQDVYHNFMPVYQDYALQRSEKEGPEVIRMKTYLAGNLDSVAIEMSHRYRGRNKRLAFNSLLRGDVPIRARPRSRRPTGDEPLSDSSSDHRLHLDGLSDCDSDIGSSEHSETGLVASESAEMDGQAGPSGVLADSYIDEGKDELTPLERDILDRRRLAMATHGIGIVVGKSGVEMRPANYFPTEEEGVVNEHFMKGRARNRRAPVLNPLNVSLNINPSASVLPRIPKKTLPDKREGALTTTASPTDELENQIIPPLPRPSHLSLPAPPPLLKAIPPPSHRSNVKFTSAYLHPPRMLSAESGWVADWDDSQLDGSEHWGDFMQHDEDNDRGSVPAQVEECVGNHRYVFQTPIGGKGQDEHALHIELSQQLDTTYGAEESQIYTNRVPQGDATTGVSVDSVAVEPGLDCASNDHGADRGEEGCSDGGQVRKDMEERESGDMEGAERLPTVTVTDSTQRGGEGSSTQQHEEESEIAPGAPSESTEELAQENSARVSVVVVGREAKVETGRPCAEVSSLTSELAGSAEYRNSKESKGGNISVCNGGAVAALHYQVDETAEGGTFQFGENTRRTFSRYLHGGISPPPPTQQRNSLVEEVSDDDNAHSISFRKEGVSDHANPAFTDVEKE